MAGARRPMHPPRAITPRVAVVPSHEGILIREHRGNGVEHLGGGGVEGGDVYQLTFSSTENRCRDRAWLCGSMASDVKGRGVLMCCLPRGIPGLVWSVQLSKLGRI
jgi:hypothetical protein